jgi:hypothetical protein
MKHNDQADSGNVRRNGVNPYILFGALGITLVLVSAIFFLLDMEMLAELFVNLGVSVVAVVIVEFIWRRYGGDPVVRAIMSLRRATKQLGELELSGVTSIRLQRRQLEQPEHLALWCRLLRSATHVDLMAFTLGAEVSGHREIMTGIKQSISSNLCRVRVLTFHPAQETPDPRSVALQRIQEEELFAEGRGAKDRFRGTLQQTWSQFQEIQKEFSDDPERKECLQLRSTTHITMYLSIIRIDDRMWVSPYLSSAKGGDSPAFEISGTQTPLFQLFQKEFDHVWDHGSSV